MSDNQSMLLETADSVFSQMANADFTATWEAIEEAGFSILLLDEDAGGFGGDWSDFYAVMCKAGRHSLALPLGELMLATWCANSAGLELPAGATSIAVDIAGTASDGQFSGVLRRVPWGRNVSTVVAVTGGQVLLVSTDGAGVTEHYNPAGESRDDLHFDAAPIASTASDIDLRACAALMRVAQISGATDAALEMSIEHVNTRKQFGRPLAKFQAVQQNLAIFASEAAAINSAGQAAAVARDRDIARDGASFEIAAAKLRANMASGTATSIAHQVHGAIGFTEEYPLHQLTRRMMGWRSEYGNDRYWAELLGTRVAGLGGAGLWKEMTRRSD